MKVIQAIIKAIRYYADKMMYCDTCKRVTEHSYDLDEYTCDSCGN